MKILLISAINTHVEIEIRYPQLGLGYLVSYARKSLGAGSHEFEIINTDIEETLDSFRPDLVGISCFSPNYGIAKRYASLCRQRSVPVIVGGIHISMLPSSFSKDMDVGVLYEGEETMAELISLYDRTSRFDEKDLANVKGIIYWHDGHTKITEPRELIKKIDDIPPPARDLLNLKGTHLSMFTSRGCPYECVFCASTRFWRTVRLASAKYVANEIKDLYYNYGAKLISFYDDLFVANKKRLYDLRDVLDSEGILGKIRFSCSARSNLIDDEMVKILKEMNVVSVALGLESGHKRILNYLKGSSVTIDDNFRAVNLLDKNGIAPNAAFVIGSPDESKDEILATYDFIRNVPLRNFNVYVMTPLPGTPIWDEAVERGCIAQDFDDWAVLDAVHFTRHYKKAIIVSQKLSRDDLCKVYKKFQRLRYWTYLKNAHRHPFTKDLPRMLAALAKERAVELKRKLQTNT